LTAADGSQRSFDSPLYRSDVGRLYGAGAGQSDVAGKGSMVVPGRTPCDMIESPDATAADDDRKDEEGWRISATRCARPYFAHAVQAAVFDPGQDGGFLVG